MSDQTKEIKKYFSEEYGFIPNTPEDIIIKYLAKLASDHELNMIKGVGNVMIGMQVPVWPKFIEGSELEYVEQQVKGLYRAKLKSDIILSGDNAITMGYNNLPESKKFTLADYNSLPKQFYIVGACDIDKTIIDKIVFLKPRVESVSAFTYEGLLLFGIYYGDIQLVKEV